MEKSERTGLLLGLVGVVIFGLTLGAAAVLLGEQITWFEIAFALLVVAIVAVGRRMRVS